MRSMTGYGAASGRVGKGIIFAEVKSVNSRFLDLNCKIPPRMNVIEPKIRRLIQDSVLRGKVDIFLKERVEVEESIELSLNLPLANQYKKCLHQLEKSMGVKSYSHLLEVVDLKELIIFRDRHVSFDKLWKEIEKVIAAAVVKFNKMRASEGSNLKHDQGKRVMFLAKMVDKIQKSSDAWLVEYKEKALLEAKESPHLSEETINAQIGSVLDRLDVTEELTRLKSHISQYRSLLNGSGAVGRQLDFLIQEIHREINTLGSKTNNAGISKLVVEFKSEIEKLREQVQNIE